MNRFSRLLAAAWIGLSIASAAPVHASEEAAVSSPVTSGVCGQPLSSGDAPTARDSWFVLRVAVGLEACNRCVCDVDDSGSIASSDALAVLQSAVGLFELDGCPACDPEGLQCPTVAQFALFAKIRGACTSNADCAAFAPCDTSIGRCRTRTDSDVGWTGLSHNADTDDPVPARVFLGCDGPAPCGQCEITGHDPSLGNCRCAADNRQRCFTVAGPDEEYCGGGECICNFGPPMPLSAGNTPVCVLNTVARQPGGLVNVDQGSGVIELHLAEKIFLGQSLLQPCPVCVNDTKAADGVRDGTCVGGLNDTQTCDAQAYNSTFPPPTGALYSLDCFPDPGANISGPGLLLSVNLDTGRSELAAEVPCAVDGPLAGLDCPCRVCSGNFAVPCHSDAECAEAGAGTCSSNGDGTQTSPNDCSSGVCESIGGNEGACADGPDDTFCDAIVRADGTGLVTCNQNADCAPENLGVDAGLCTLMQRRPCFLDPIVSQGAPHPVLPFAAATYCSPATASSSVNTIAGFPGPGRLALQTAVSLYCKSDPTKLYAPGSGGCP
jgi:hypothetical protein